MYSTWLSLEPRGYCERSLLELWESALTRRGAERDECWEDCSREDALDHWSGSEVRSLSFICRRGEGSGREANEACERGRDEGKDESEVRRGIEDAEALENAVMPGRWFVWGAVAVILASAAKR